MGRRAKSECLDKETTQRIFQFFSEKKMTNVLIASELNATQVAVSNWKTGKHTPPKALLKLAEEQGFTP